MDLQKAQQLLELHSRNAWPQRSTLVYGETTRTLAVSLGTERSPVLMLITAHRALPAAVELVAAIDVSTGERSPVGVIDEPETLALLGGALVQAHNVVTQLQQLGCRRARD